MNFFKQIINRIKPFFLKKESKRNLEKESYIPRGEISTSETFEEKGDFGSDVLAAEEVINEIECNNEQEINQPTLKALNRILKYNTNQIFRILNSVAQIQLSKQVSFYHEKNQINRDELDSSPFKFRAEELHEEIDLIKLPQINTSNFLDSCRDLKRIQEIDLKEEKKRSKERLEEFLSFGLCAVESERIRKHEEDEKLKQEKLLNEKFDDLLEQARKRSGLKDYSEAFSKINEAKSIVYSRTEECDLLFRRINHEKNTWEKKQRKFAQYFNLGDDYMAKEEWSDAIDSFLSAKKYCSEHEVINERIKLCRFRLDEELRRKKEEEEKRKQEALRKVIIKKQEERRLQLIQEQKELYAAEQRRKEQQLKEEAEKYKSEKEEILQTLKQQGFNQLYHFTDSTNIPMIKAHGGLYSWKACEELKIAIPNPGGDSLSRGLDRRYGLEDYVRFSFHRHNPMLYIARDDGRINKEEWLDVDLEVAAFRETQYSDMNATKTGHKVGDDLIFLEENIRYDLLKKKNQFDIEESQRQYYQAEVMVKRHVPLEYIKNL